MENYKYSLWNTVSDYFTNIRITVQCESAQMEYLFSPSMGSKLDILSIFSKNKKNMDVK